MTKLKIALSAATLFAAVGAGTFLIAQQTGVALPPVAPSTGSPELASLQAENQHLKAEVARLQKAISDSTPSPLAELRALVTASQQKVIPPLYQLVRVDKEQLSPEFAALFNLTADEKTAVEKELVKVRDELGVLAAANVAGVDRPLATREVVRFKLFPDAGGKVHDQFVDELAKTLGTERFTALQALMGEGFDWVLGSGFGAVEHSLTIERRTLGPADGQRFFYTASDKSQWPPTGAAQRSVSNVSALGDRATLNQKYPWLAKLLPEDF